MGKTKIEETDEQKIDRLTDIINAELSKPESQRDLDLIQECCDYIKDLMPQSSKLSDEELKAKCDALKASAQETKVEKKRSHRLSRRTAAVIIAAALIASVGLVTAAATGLIGKAASYVAEHISELLGMDPGDEKEGDGITVVKNGQYTKYDTVEDLLTGEGLDIMYPAVLPERVSIEKVWFIHESDPAKYSVTFETSSDDISCFVCNYYQTDINAIEHSEYFSSNGLTFCWFEPEVGMFQAVGQIKGCEYVIVTHDYSQMISIIDNLKESEKSFVNAD